jgi:integrase
MADHKQARIISKTQEKMVLRHLREETRLYQKNIVAFLLSTRAIMRAKEIALLQWDHLLDKQDGEWVVGDIIRLPDAICKGSSGRKIPINNGLKKALEELWELRKDVVVNRSWNVIYTIHENKTSPNSMVQWFRKLYKKLGMENYSSHSGRRTGITRICRNLHKAENSSLKDVMAISGHKQLKNLQLYIEQNEEVQKELVDLL